MIEVLKNWFLKAFIKLLPFLFRRLYSKQRLENLIEVTISSENDGITVNCSELPDARVWIEITNLSPISLSLVGTEADLNWVGKIAHFVSLESRDIGPHIKEKLYLDSSLTENQIEHLKKNHKSNAPRLNIKLYFESSIRKFEKVREIQTSNVRLINCENS